MIPEEPLPPINRFLNRSPSKTHLLLPSNLPLRIRNTLLLNILHRDEHFLGTDEIRRQVVLETARHEGAGCVAPGEEIVAPAGSVDSWIRGDVEDGAVDGEVDGQIWVGAIVEGELGGCQVNWAGLGGLGC